MTLPNLHEPDTDSDDLDWLHGPASTAPGPERIPQFTGPGRPRTMRFTGLDTTTSGAPMPAPTLVLASSGGGGATSVALGIAAAHALDGVWTVCADMTPAGGDLGLRGPDAAPAIGTMQTWLRQDEPSLPSALESVCGRSSTGVRVLARDSNRLPHRESFLSVRGYLCDGGWTPVLDAGAPVTAAGVQPLLADPRMSVVIVCQARADAANRLWRALEWIDTEHSEFTVSDIAIVVTRQTPYDTAQVTNYLRSHTDGYVRSVSEIPYDPHIAAGSALVWEHLMPRTRTAFSTLVEELR